MSNSTSIMKKTVSRAAVLMLPMLLVPLSVEPGAIEPSFVCGAETGEGDCEFTILRMCEKDGEMLQDAMPVL